MATGAQIAARVAATLQDVGETMTLLRPGGATVTVYGKRHGAAVELVAGDRSQNTITVHISNREIAAAAWPGPPIKEDKLTMAGADYRLEADADTRWHDGVVVMHILKVRG